MLGATHGNLLAYIVVCTCMLSYICAVTCKGQHLMCWCMHAGMHLSSQSKSCVCDCSAVQTQVRTICFQTQPSRAFPGILIWVPWCALAGSTAGWRDRSEADTLTIAAHRVHLPHPEAAGPGWCAGHLEERLVGCSYAATRAAGRCLHSQLPVRACSCVLQTVCGHCWHAMAADCGAAG